MDRKDLFRLFSPGGQNPPESPRKHLVMVVDLRRCVGCQACTVACAMENRTPLGQFRTSVTDFEILVQGVPRKVLTPRLCNHCDDPPCVPVCPAKATFKRADGLVLVDPARCVGCGYCVLNCPYGARFLNHHTHRADKCTLCVHRLDAGLLPACVETCVGKARIVGDLADPKSRVSRLLAEAKAVVLKPEAGTRPQVFYLGASENDPLPEPDMAKGGFVRVTEENFR
ncbi:tetrathionate reductase subunit TtrB [Fundidesulfovibrio butyratiphilus]